VFITNVIWVEEFPTSPETVTISAGDKLNFTEITLPIAVAPGVFFLAQLFNYINMPCNVSGIFFLDSKLARIGWEHSAATFIHPGWSGMLTLELKNVAQYHNILVEPNMQVGKIVFFEHDTTEGYSGRYQNQGIGEVT
jgi:deoxycytidine triphosphate deaminase